MARFPLTGPESSSLLKHVTCAATSEKFILLGYMGGSVALFDVFGHPLDVQADRHTAPVVSVALGGGTTQDDIAASACADGNIRANPLLDPSSRTASVTLSARAAIRTKSQHGVSVVAVDPDYGKPRTGSRIAYADHANRIVLYTVGWFGGSESELACAETPVHAMEWAGLLLAWATDRGVTVFDTRTRGQVAFFEDPAIARSVGTRVSAKQDDAAVSTEMKTLTAPTPDSEAPAAGTADDIDASNAPNVDETGEARAASGQEENSSEPANPVAEFASEGPDPLRSTDGAQHGHSASVPSGTHPSSARHMPLWRSKTSLVFDCDEAAPTTSHGERPMTLYIAWHSAARVVVIGPHSDLPPGFDKESPGDLNDEVHVRDIQVSLSLSRESVPVSLGLNHPDTTSSPLLSIAPFRDSFAVLVGTVFHGLMLAYVPANSALPIRCTRLEHTRVLHARLRKIPGGEPLLLVLAQNEESVPGMLPPGSTKILEDETDIAMGYNELASDDDEDGNVVADALDGSMNAVDHELDSEPDGSTLSPEGAAGKDPDDQGPDKPTDENVHRKSEFQSVVFARALGVAERVTWMLDQGRFEDALKVAEVAPGGSLRRAEVSIAQVGNQFLESIRAKGNFKRLADVLPRTIVSTSPTIAMGGRENVMAFRRERWEYWINVFRKAGQLATIVTVIPCEEPRMSAELYNAVAVELAEKNPAALLDALKTWPATVYDVAAVTRAVEARSTALSGTGRPLSFSLRSKADTSPDRDALREALFMLYGLSGRHDETLNMLLTEESPSVFEYIASHNLYEAIRSEASINALFGIDKEKATALLAEAPVTLLPPAALVPILKKSRQRERLYSYLQAVFVIDPERAAEYHGLQLELLVEFGVGNELFTFLKTSEDISLDAALKLMGGRRGRGRGQFGKERVYVLAAMGDLSSALDILLKELDNVQGAIDFASEHDNSKLWDQLIDHAKGDADTLAALLDSPAGGKVDPMRLLPLISTSMEIPRLRDRLHRILVDAALERALQEETADALYYDAARHMAELDRVVTGPL